MNKPALRTVFIRDLVLPVAIGLYAHERGHTQRVRFNVELGVPDEPPQRDAIDEVLCYDGLAGGIRQLAAQGHVNLVETLAERVMALCLAQPGAQWARVRVEKLDVFPDAVSAGVEIERHRH
jgi:dihydroneopterin aldolase